MFSQFKVMIAHPGRSCGLTFLVLAALIAFVYEACEAKSTAVRMQNVVRNFVQQTGNDVVGLGSWIRGGQYRDVLTAGNVVKAYNRTFMTQQPIAIQHRSVISIQQWFGIPVTSSTQTNRTEAKFPFEKRNQQD